MTAEERSKMIEAYGGAYAQLTAALAQLPREMWQYRRDRSAWTVHEIVVHIADSEVNSYVRCRRLIAEPGSAVLGYDEVKWAVDLNYHQQSPEDALELFKWLRHKSYALIRALPEAVWAHTVEHSENGVIRMEDWLETYTRHIPEHIRQMQENHASWNAQAGQSGQ
jgi:hypothetical protein